MIYRMEIRYANLLSVLQVMELKKALAIQLMIVLSVGLVHLVLAMTSHVEIRHALLGKKCMSYKIQLDSTQHAYAMSLTDTNHLQ